MKICKLQVRQYLHRVQNFGQTQATNCHDILAISSIPKLGKNFKKQQNSQLYRNEPKKFPKFCFVRSQVGEEKSTN